MGKGNLMLGYGRGKMGSVVFSRAKGKQIFKAYNDSPNNPKSEYQMTQRATFLNAVKFFARGTQNLFRFAYEDKRNNESDFNAFMRNNVKGSAVITQKCYNDAAYPAIGNWLLTRGSLDTIFSYFDANNFYPLASFDTENSETWGEFSEELIDKGYKNGDIVTTVFIVSSNDFEVLDLPLLEPVTGATPKQWEIGQIVIDTSSKETLAEALKKLNSAITIVDNKITLKYNDRYVTGGATIVSRQTKNKLFVSTQYLLLPTTTEECLDRMRSNDWVASVLATWNATSPSILQGSEV